MSTSQEKSAVPGEPAPSGAMQGWMNKHKVMMRIRFHNLKPHSPSNITGTFSVRAEMDYYQCATDFRSHKSNRGKATIINEAPAVIRPPQITSYMEFNIVAKYMLKYNE